VLRIFEAALLALLLGVVCALVAESEKAGAFFGLFFFIGLAGYSFLLFRSATSKVFFRFSLIFGIEWFLLPVAAGINAGQADTIGGALGAGILLAMLGPVGVLMGLLFLVLAFLRSRSQSSSAST